MELFVDSSLSIKVFFSPDCRLSLLLPPLIFDMNVLLIFPGNCLCEQFLGDNRCVSAMLVSTLVLNSNLYLHYRFLIFLIFIFISK